MFRDNDEAATSSSSSCVPRHVHAASIFIIRKVYNDRPEENEILFIAIRDTTIKIIELSNYSF